MAGTLGKRLMVLSLARHAMNNGNNYSYEPYVRELNLWCELYDEVDIYTQLDTYNEKNRHSFAQFRHDNVKLKKIWSYPVGDSLLSRILHILTLPFLTLQMLVVIHRYDLIHIRNSSLPSAVLGLIVRLFRKSTITKWAGNFAPYPNEPVLSKLDRKVAGMGGKHCKTLIYSKSDKPHLVSFIPALMSSEEIDSAQRMSADKPSIEKQLNIVSIGRLHPTKNFELIPLALNVLQKTAKFQWHYHCIGDGVLMPKLQELVSRFGLNEHVTFHGAMTFNDAQKILAASHILIMPGILEGWPKPIAEGWAHNTFPLASNGSNIPDILDSMEKGIIFNADADSLAQAVQQAFHKLSHKEVVNLKAYANELSLETFKDRLQLEINSL